MKTVINQSSSNYWIGLGFFMTLGLFLGTIVLMKDSWPPSLSFEWFLFPCLFAGALLGMFIYAFWILFPRKFTIEILENHVIIHEQPLFKTTTRTFKADTIISIKHHVDYASYLITKDGKEHKIHQITMMRKKEIFKTIAKFHPHIKCTSDEINLFKKSEPEAP